VEVLIQSLQGMIELLEQVLAITHNQMTVLLERNDEDECIQMLEQMVSYKENLTTQIEQKEQGFQAQYDSIKEGPLSVEQQKRLKEWVAKVLLLKDQIIEAEQKNFLLLQDASRRCATKIEIPKNPNQVVDAYKQQIKK
jgi:hypothetical protein